MCGVLSLWGHAFLDSVIWPQFKWIKNVDFSIETEQTA